MSEKNLKKKKRKNFILNKIIILILILAAAGSATAVYYMKFRKKPTSFNDQNLALHTVQRGDLVVSITEAGDIKAIKTNDVQCEVEGRTTIISIVDEGYLVTQEDIENGKVLIELDSSQIEQDLNKQQVTLSSAQASYTEASESLQIQVKQNESDIQEGEMDVQFALMDFEKYLGKELASKAVSDVNINDDFSNYNMKPFLTDKRLGGEALQKLIQQTSDIELADSRLQRAKDRLKGTVELLKEGYVAETEKTADELEVQSLQAQLEESKIKLDLFKKYEFPKNTQKLLSDYFESLRELDRIQARARSKLAQEQAQLRNKKLTLDLQQERLDKLEKQLAACTIKATAVGQVVYGSSLLDFRRRTRETIEVGAEIRERQILITIPDMSLLKVDVKVPENMIGQIQVGQYANITISAFPDSMFTGQVLAKAPLADPENFWNPAQKVYTTQVTIDGTHNFVKTGMSARVEIIVDTITNVLTVPVQSVSSIGIEKFCYVMTDEGPKKCIVETGAFNSDFVEIKSGLRTGEQVLLVPQRLADAEAMKQKANGNGQKSKQLPSDKTGQRKRPQQGQGRPRRRPQQ